MHTKVDPPEASERTPEAASLRRVALFLPDMGGGGAERVALDLLQDWIDEGWQVDLVLLRADGALLALVPSKVRVIDLKAPRIRAAIVPLVRYVRRERPYALHALMWPLTAIAVFACVLVRATTRIVLAEHSTLSKQYEGRGWAHRLFLRMSLRWAYRRADGGIAVSDGVADDLASLSGLAKDNFETIPNPFRSQTEERPVLPEIAALWGEASLRLLTIGRLSLEKNHALLLNALALLRRSRDARLVLVGEGPLRQGLERRAEEPDLRGAVVFTGFALETEPYLRAAQLFVLSSDLEGYPLVLLEALRAGLRVVSTDCRSGPRQILGDGRYGSLVPCGDAPSLAAAIDAAAGAPSDPELLKRRVQELGGAEAFGRYRALMMG